MSSLVPIAGIEPMPIAQMLAPAPAAPKVEALLCGRIAVEGRVKIPNHANLTGKLVLERLLLAGAPIKLPVTWRDGFCWPRLGKEVWPEEGWVIGMQVDWSDDTTEYWWMPELPEFPEADR